MKRAILLTMVIMLSLLTAQLVSASSQANYDVERIVEIRNNGLVYVIDSLNIKAGGSIAIGFDIRLKDKLITYYAENPELKIRYLEDGDQALLFFIEVSNPTDRDLRAKITTVFMNLISEKERGSFIVNIPTLPVLKRTVGSFYLLVKFPSGSQVGLVERPGFNYTEDGQSIYAELRNVDLITPDIVSVNFKNGNYRMLVIELADVRISLDTYRRVSYFLRVLNNGKSTIDTIDLNLPVGAKVLSVKDSIGDLTYQYDPDTGLLSVKTRLKLKEGERFSFTINYIEEGREGGILSSIQYPFVLDALYGKYTLSIEIPPGFNLKDYKPEPVEIYKDQIGSTFVTYTSLNILPDMKPYVYISYSEGLAIASILPYIWSGIASIAIASILMYVLLKPAKKLILVESLKRSLTSTLHKVSETLTAIDTFISSIPSDLKEASKWSKGAYEGKILSIKRDLERLSELRRSLDKTSMELAEDLQTLESSISEILGTMTALGRAIEDLRLGRIGKLAYQKVVKGYIKSITDLKNKILDTIKEIESRIS